MATEPESIEYTGDLMANLERKHVVDADMTFGVKNKLTYIRNFKADSTIALKCHPFYQFTPNFHSEYKSVQQFISSSSGNL